jgi:hypothetical protein
MTNLQIIALKAVRETNLVMQMDLQYSTITTCIILESVSKADFNSIFHLGRTFDESSSSDKMSMERFIRINRVFQD